MSFYRTLLAAVAAVALATPVFADDTATAPAAGTDTTTQQAAQANDNSNANAAAQQVSSTDQATPATENKVDLNKATAKDLMKIKGLSAAKAHAIIAFRKKHGEFKSIDDLSMVKGFKKMKPDTLKNIQSQLSVQ